MTRTLLQELCALFAAALLSQTAAGKTIRCIFNPPLSSTSESRYSCTAEFLASNHYRVLGSCRAAASCALNLPDFAVKSVRIWSPDSRTPVVSPGVVRFATFPRIATVTKGPWISDVSAVSAVVRWETDRYAQSWLRIVNVFNQVPHVARWINGVSTCATAGSPGPCLHTVKVNGLISAHRYDFVIGDGLRSDPDAGAHATGFLETTPSSTAAFGFSAFADVQGGDVFGDLAPYIPAIAGAGPLLQTGDMVSGAGGWPVFFSRGAAALRRLPFYPALGNGDPEADFSRFFGFPSNPSKTPYRSFGYANTHFILLHSTNCAFSATDPQVVWLKNDLVSAAAASSRNIVIAVHHGPYGYGRYNNNGPLVNLLTALEADPAYQSAFAKIRLVLSGHQHYYERIGMDYPNVQRRVRFLILGSAGADPACPGVGKGLELSSVCQDDSKNYQFAAFQVRRTTIEGRVYNFKYDPNHNPVLVDGSRYSLIDCFAFDEFGKPASTAIPCVP